VIAPEALLAGMTAKKILVAAVGKYAQINTLNYNFALEIR
jgi:hypothetical protein